MATQKIIKSITPTSFNGEFGLEVSGAKISGTFSANSERVLESAFGTIYKGDILVCTFSVSKKEDGEGYVYDLNNITDITTMLTLSPHTKSIVEAIEGGLSE